MLLELEGNSTQTVHYTIDKNPFSSFWMAGFECTDKQNYYGKRVDFLKITGHLEKIREDYNNLELFNIKTVREGIRWSHVEKRPHEYDWTAVGEMIKAGKEKGIQQVWDICHFGYPDDMSPLHPAFALRFELLCSAFIKFYRTVDPFSTLIVTPINEVSFISWLGGDEAATVPYCRNNGWEVKYALMKAYIRGVKIIKEIDNNVRILTTEPLLNIVPSMYADEKELVASAGANEAQFQVLEILGGNICPELGGSPEYLDILGFNYYYNNQWVAATHEFLSWSNELADPRWKSLSQLLTEAYNRYNRPMVLSETSHPKEDRPLWINFIANECAAVVTQNIPLWGICWYPIIDRPDWDHLTPWHRSGIWDIVADGDIYLQRILHEPSARALLQAQELITV